MVTRQATALPLNAPSPERSDERPAVTMLPGAGEAAHKLRIVEALLFAASEPLSLADIAAGLPSGSDAPALLAELQKAYAYRGVNVVQVAGKWALRTAPDLGFVLHRHKVTEKRLSRAALETLAIIAYHQPVTRAEIEQVRGVSLSRGTLDLLMETGWVRLCGRRHCLGRPLTYATTAAFLEHFGLDDTGDLPGVAELRAAGLLSADPPAELFASASQAPAKEDS